MNSASMSTKSFVSGSRHNVGGNIGFRRRGWKVTWDENGKYISLGIAGEGGKPVLGYSFPKDVPNRARKIREQAKALRRIAERLERKAGELEKRRPKGKIIWFLGRYHRKETPSKSS